MSERVLLVDDEVDFLQSLQERMELRGMRVTTAENTDAAIAAIDSKVFDAVVLDLQMPGMDGIEMLQHIKDVNPDMQVILLTGHATLEKGIQAIKLGAMDFMEKPADIDALTEKIKKARDKTMDLAEQKAKDQAKQIMKRRGW